MSPIYRWLDCLQSASNKWRAACSRERAPRKRSKQHLPFRVIELESRLNPANATLIEGVLTVDFTATGTTLESVSATCDGTHIILAGNVAGSLNNPVGSVNKIVVQDSGGSNAQFLTFTSSTALTLSGGFLSTNVENTRIANSIKATGAGAIFISGGIIDTFAPLTTSGGSLTLQATGNISVRAPILTSGGNLTFKADSDGDGAGTFQLASAITEFVDPHPVTGNRFGESMATLPSGNVVVTSPRNNFGGTDAGAVYLFNGSTGQLISTLQGKTQQRNAAAVPKFHCKLRVFWGVEL